MACSPEIQDNPPISKTVVCTGVDAKRVSATRVDISVDFETTGGDRPRVFGIVTDRSKAPKGLTVTPVGDVLHLPALGNYVVQVTIATDMDEIAPCPPSELP